MYTHTERDVPPLETSNRLIHKQTIVEIVSETRPKLLTLTTNAPDENQRVAKKLFGN